MFIKRVKCWWIDSVGRDPSLFVWARLSGSSIARNLKKYSEMFTEGVKCWRIDSVGHGRTRPVSLCVGSTERKFDRCVKCWQNYPIGHGPSFRVSTSYCRKLFKGHLSYKLSFYYNLDGRNHKAKYTAYNKHITRVYTSFF